jgi:inner membrane protein
VDPVTHAISGAVANRAFGPAQARPDQFTCRERSWLGAGLALFPDIDYVLVFLADPLTYLNLHRGITHSLVMLPLWALLIGWLLARVWPVRRDWRDGARIASISIGIHITGDFITNYGTMLFAPLSWKALSFPSTFIIDPWITLLLAAGLVLMARRPGRLWPRAALAAAAALVAIQSALMLEARGLAADAASASGLHPAGIHAFPQPLSPLHWRLVIETPEAQLEAHLGFLRPREAGAGRTGGRLTRHWSMFRSPEALHWRAWPRWGVGPEGEFARRAWAREEFEGFRRFAVLPYV